MKTNNEPRKATSWTREPWMWLVWGLPASVVVAGVVTMVLAAQNPETLVNAPHSKVGLTVEKIDASATPAPVDTQK